MAVQLVERKIETAQAPFFKATDRYYVSAIVLAVCVAPIYILAAGWLGYKVLVLLFLSCLTGAAVEMLGSRITGRPLNYIGIASWLVFPLLVPPGLPMWMALLGLVLSLIIAQTLFGGFGEHIVHPAAFAQLVILINFPLQFNSSFLAHFRNPYMGFSRFSSASLTNVTDFDLFSLGMSPPLTRMLTGPHVGLMGEMFPGLVLIAGLVYIVFADVNLRTPVAFLISMIIMSILGNILFPTAVLSVVPAVLGGSTLFYALFIFTDHWTSTKTGGGRIIAGVTAALITIIVRSFSSNREGIMFAAIFNYTFGVLYDEIVLNLTRKMNRSSK